MFIIWFFIIWFMTVLIRFGWLVRIVSEMIAFICMYISHIIKFSSHSEFNWFRLYILKFLYNSLTSRFIRVDLILLFHNLLCISPPHFIKRFSGLLHFEKSTRSSNKNIWVFYYRQKSILFSWLFLVNLSDNWVIIDSVIFML